MNNSADLKKIEYLLTSEITSYQISKETGISTQSLDKYRKGLKISKVTGQSVQTLRKLHKDISDVEKMPLNTAIKLTELYSKHVVIGADNKEFLSFVGRLANAFNEAYMDQIDSYEDKEEGLEDDLAIGNVWKKLSRIVLEDPDLVSSLYEEYIKFEQQNDKQNSWL